MKQEHKKKKVQSPHIPTMMLVLEGGFIAIKDMDPGTSLSISKRIQSIWVEVDKDFEGPPL